MSNFNFTSQICTTREQSESLMALGLKKETADMAYLWYGRAEDDSPMLMDKPSLVYQGIMTTHDLPAWSLHRLWELGKFMGINLSSDVAIPNLYEFAIARIEKQVQKGYFNKEYLV